jgi:N-acetyl-anhydromuramyl-L-alanine amidase AmpD
MKAWNPMSLIKAAEIAGVDFDVDDTWLDINPYGSTFNPVGVVWHHTGCSPFAKGDMPSLSWCRFPGEYSGDARACHIIVGRSGRMQIIAGNGAYHAGAGGPMTVNNKVIPKDEGNRYLIGIEIEASSSTKVNNKNRITPKWGMNEIQFDSVARYCAALFDLLDWPTESAIRHQDWAPRRKTDVGIKLNNIRTFIDLYRKPQLPVETEVVEVEKPKKPVVRLLQVKPAYKNHDIRIMQEALKKEFPHSSIIPTGLFNNNTKIVYKKWQEKCGFEGDDADGIPGRDTLSKLGKKHGFTVK